VFGPNLIRPKIETVQNALEMPLLQGIVQILIEQADLVLERDGAKTLTRRESRRFAPSGRPLSMLFVGKDLMQIAQEEGGAEGGDHAAPTEGPATGDGTAPKSGTVVPNPVPPRTKRGSVRYRANQIQAMHNKNLGEDGGSLADGSRGGNRTLPRSKLAGTSPLSGSSFTTSPSSSSITAAAAASSAGSAGSGGSGGNNFTTSPAPKTSISPTIIRQDSPGLTKKRIKTKLDVVSATGSTSTLQPPPGPAPPPPTTVAPASPTAAGAAFMPAPPQGPAPVPPISMTAVSNASATSVVVSAPIQKRVSKSKRHGTDTL